MKSFVEVVARRGRSGKTEFPVVRAEGQLAVRRTGSHRIHLVATAFGPMGGDSAVVRMRVEAGARLEVCSVAAALCLPAREAAPSRLDLRADLADDARLELLLEPTVVAAEAHHQARTDLLLAASAHALVSERVVLGRHGEAAGRWVGTTRIERNALPVLHTSVDLGSGSPTWAPPTMARAYATELVLGPSDPTPASGPDTPQSSRTGPRSVRLPLPGGHLATAWGDQLDDVIIRLADLGTHDQGLDSGRTRRSRISR